MILGLKDLHGRNTLAYLAYSLFNRKKKNWKRS